MLAVIRFYQVFLSYCFVPCCRYQPTCSQYCYEAIAKRGILRGGFLGVKRLLRCHPFGGSGWDPVP